MDDKKRYPNSGVMYKNNKKRDGKNDPDGDGSMELDVECPHCQNVSTLRYFINGWRKAADRDGNPWWSFAFKLKQPRGMTEGFGNNSHLRGGNDSLKQSSANLQGGGAKSTPSTRSFRQDDDGEIPF